MARIVIEHNGTPVDTMTMTRHQKQIVEAVATLVHHCLLGWPRQSGKTVTRKMIAQVILDLDGNNDTDH